MGLSQLLEPLRFADMPGWAEDSHASAFRAFRRSAQYARKKPYKTGSLGIEAASFDKAFAAALSFDKPVDDVAARAFFEAFFRPCRIRPDDRPRGFVTGFYEPVAAASRHRDENHQVPLLRRPADLVDVDDGNRPIGFDAYFAFGRQTRGGIVEYPDRRAIERGVLDDEEMAIAWLSSRIDAFFIHVQGAAFLHFSDGSAARVTYAAKSGHRFTGIGGVLVELGEMPLREVTMLSIRAWLHDNPDRIDEILWRNKSYIFFRETDLGDPDAGPIAAAKVQLEPGRSVAVDRLLHTFGTPIHVDAPALDAFGKAPFRRLMIAQDTGSAIVGSARGDLFTGSGEAAGNIAGVIRSDADFYALVPRELP